MTATKVMDIIFRLPGCAGQAADAVSAYTQENGGCSQIIENSQIGILQGGDVRFLVLALLFVVGVVHRSIVLI